MKLQVAIDRVSLEYAKQIASDLNGIADIVEIGTSLVKDYGNQAILEISEILTKSHTLVDSKTIDEGAYEFTQAFEHGADIVTVMGAASYETIAACYDVANDYHKVMMIDLLNLNDNQIKQIADFREAIYLLHHSVDKTDQLNAVEAVEHFKYTHPAIQKIAIAGGLDYEAIERLSSVTDINIAVVGSKIIKTENLRKTAEQFMEVIK